MEKHKAAGWEGTGSAGQEIHRCSQRYVGRPTTPGFFPPIILILLFFIMVSIPFNPYHLFDPSPPPLVASASDSVVESVSWLTPSQNSWLPEVAQVNRDKEQNETSLHGLQWW